MCGIFGASTLTPATRAMMPFLASEMEDRGRDSWGASDGSVVVRGLGEISEVWAASADRWAQWDGGIWHTRQASHGSVTLENAHPFTVTNAEGRKLIGIHNGCITNWWALNKKYERDVPVDSWHIWHHLIAGLPLRDLEGYGNLAWWDIAPDGSKVLKIGWFGTRSLHAYRLPTTLGEFVFASTQYAVQKAIGFTGMGGGTYWVLEEGKIYTLKSGDEAPMQVGELGWEIRASRNGAYSAHSSSARNYRGNSRWSGWGLNGDEDDGTLPFSSYVHTGTPTPNVGSTEGLLDGKCNYCTSPCSRKYFMCRACMGMWYSDYKMWLQRQASGTDLGGGVVVG